MNSVNIKDIDLNNSFFHFTIRENMEQISQEGLKAKIGDASKMKTESKARVYMSKGGKGILGIKNSFIHEFKKLRICEIPTEYRKYFEIKDFSSEEIVHENDVYAAMKKRFKDEIYFKVNAINGEDFIPEDFLPEELINEINSSNNIRDIKGKANHDIVPDKLSLIETDKGDSVLDILEYLYDRLMENAKKNGKQESAKWALSDLDGLFNYIRQKENVERQIILYKMKNGKSLNPDEILELKDRPLTKIEAFSIVEDDPKKLEEYSNFIDLQEKAESGELTPEQLKFLCDTAFGIDSEESKKVYSKIIKTGRIKPEFSEQEIGKATINISTLTKYDAQCNMQNNKSENLKEEK